MIAEKTISETDMDLILFTDSVEDAIEHLRKYAIHQFELKPKRNFRPIWFLGENNR